MKKMKKRKVIFCLFCNQSQGSIDISSFQYNNTDMFWHKVKDWISRNPRLKKTNWRKVNILLGIPTMYM